ncbi:APC5 protein, partial [Coemansia sp. RSA 2618]
MQSSYLSATKFILLVAVDQYSRHYDWGPQALCSLSTFLVEHLHAPTWSASYHALATAAQRIPVDGSTLRQKLALRMAEQLATVDSLHAFFDAAARLVVDAETGLEMDLDATLLDSESIFGVFVRRCCLAFARLEFHLVGEFLDECRRATRAFSRNPSGPVGPEEPAVCAGPHRSVLELQGSDAHAGPHRSAVEPEEPDAHAGPRRSVLELQEHVDHLTALLETSARAPAPRAMERIMRCALSRLTDQSRLHYLGYLNLVRQRECSKSEHALRRFFDSSRDTAGAAHQYALLYLAAMRAQLGAVQGALDALREARHIACDCQDHVCLLFIEAWVARLLVGELKRTGPGGGRGVESVVRGVVETATGMRNPEFQTVGYLMLSDLQLATVFESLICAHALSIEHNVHRAASHLTQAQAWLHFGCPLLALLLCAQAKRPCMSEHEHAQMQSTLLYCQHQLCGRAARPRVVFIDPECSDIVEDALGWMHVDDGAGAGDGAGADAGDCCSLLADEYALRLRDARQLLDDGYVCEANDALLSIANCPATRSPPSAHAVQIARQMLLDA